MPRCWLKGVEEKLSLFLLFALAVRKHAAPQDMSASTAIAVTSFAAALLCIFTLFNTHAPATYMDEIFHVPQVRVP
jgi:hypothetical protein